MNSSFFINSQVSLIKEYLYAANQWVSHTPERALEQAYQAALNIKSLEDDYFDGGAISAASAKDNDEIMPVLQAVLVKFLRTAKLRLAEFQASYSVVGTFIPDYLEKLKFIDDVVGKYIAQNNTSSSLPAFLVGKDIPNPVNNLLAENKPEVTSFDIPKPQEKTKNPELQTQPHLQGSIRGLVTNVGLASTLFAGGLAVGAVSVATLVAPQNAADNNIEREKSVKVHPNRTVAESYSIEKKISPSAPEIIAPESSFSVSTHSQSSKSTHKLSKQEAVAHQQHSKVNINHTTVKNHPAATDSSKHL
jgi:hypothetical protein